MPLLQGQTPSGLVCDLGLSAFADHVAKKVVGRSEEELFEALEHSDSVLDVELEGCRADDEGKETRLRFGGRGTRHCGGSSTPGRTLHVERQQSGGAAPPKESVAHCVARFGDAEDQLNALQEHEGDASRPCKNCGEMDE